MMTGCATTEYKPLPTVESMPSVQESKKKEGMYHKVAKGQTLFRISKAYGVGVEEIIASNNIPNAAAIEVDQLIFIPGALSLKDIPQTPALDANKDEFAWPIKGKVISYFNDRRGESTNRGIDIQADQGAQVLAAREGNVVLADYVSGYGPTLMLDHGDGFISVYAKSGRLLVKLGDHVFKGDPVAEVGHWGRRSFIHFELRKGELASNPLYYLP